MQKDYHSILGLQKGATLNEIKVAYRKLALKFHPDKNPGDPFFEKMFKDLKDAYEILSDEQKKSQIDDNIQQQSGPAKSKNNPSQLYEKVITDLIQMVNHLKRLNSTEIKPGDISDYLNRVLGGDILSIYTSLSYTQKRALILNISSLLIFLDVNERIIYEKKLIEIVGSDADFVPLIRNNINAEISKKKVRNTKRFFKGYWKLFGFLIFITITYIIVLTNDETNNSFYSDRNSEDQKRSVTSDYFDKVASQWKNNQLKTGDSPYDDYFGKGVYSKKLENRIKIHNGQETDVVVCLSQYNTPHHTIRNEYIRAGESFEMTNIPNGTYFIKTFYGNNWNPDTLVFDDVKGFFEINTGFSQSNNNNDLLQIEQDEKQYSIYEITLYPVEGGNMKSNPINASEFFK